ncbi:MAG: hypothetical protein J6X91_07995 [Bacteroidales bacterium]|nr:hypothetical protein [Bacteroidales bacterium]
MKNNNCIILFFVLLVAIGCGPVKKDKYRMESFMDRYLRVSVIQAEQSDGRSLAIVYSWTGAIQQGGNNSEFKAISKKNGDTGYNVSFSRSSDGLYGFCYSLENNLKSIKLYAIDSYNSKYGSGAVLNGMVRYLSTSISPFISSGYKNTFTMTENNTSDLFRNYLQNLYLKPLNYPQFVGKQEKPYFPVDKLLKDVSATDFKLVFPFMKTIGGSEKDLLGYLYFEELPNAPGNYNIKVEITDEIGNVYSSQITMNFDY